MMKDMMDSVEVTPVDERKKIAGYDCRRVNVKMMMASDYWVSKDGPGYEELKRISGQVADKLKGNPMLAQLTQAAMINKLDGFPVQVVTRVPQRTVTTTLQKIEQKSLSADLFQVPPGYTRVEQPVPRGAKPRPWELVQELLPQGARTLWSRLDVTAGSRSHDKLGIGHCRTAPLEAD